MKTRILAIETSCDETAAAVIQHNDAGLTVLSSVVSSQVELHTKYGGVVPNLAAREHTRNIIPVIEEALEKASVTRDEIDAIAVTQGPGLIPALLVGVSAAKTLALVWQKPLLGIHHLEGHIYANFIGNAQSPKSNNQKDIFPLLALIVSGGHTQLVLMRDHFQYEIIGETRDDAAGEAFDKVARILGLPYPGGPAIAQRAEEFLRSVIPAKAETQAPQERGVHFPRPMINSDDLDFSFSGLKTAVLYLVKENESKKTDDDFINEVAYEFQNAVIDVLVAKTRKAIEQHSPKTIIIAGGVSANVRLRERMRKMVDTYSGSTATKDADVAIGPFFLTPEFAYSLDNAAMIGSAAALRFARLSPEERKALKENALALEPNANLPLG